jgi:hypothetical protein
MNQAQNDKSIVRGVELRLDMALDGTLNAFPPSLQQITVRGVSYDQSSLATKLQQTASPWKNARDAHATLRQFAQDKPELAREALQLLGDLKASLSGQIGRDNQELARFGFAPLQRPKPLTVEQKVLRTAKAKLTRQKRGTKGKNQLAEIQETETPRVTIGPDASMKIEPASQVSAEPTKEVSS